MDPLHHDVAIPGVPEDPGDVLPTLCQLLDVLLDRAEPGRTGWSVEPEAGGDEVGAFGTRVADGLRFSVSIRGVWDDEEPPSHWTLAADVWRQPVVTQADKITGAVAVGLCLAGGVGAGGGVFWLLSEHPYLAVVAALPVGLLATLACLVLAVFVTPRSAQPPVPPGVREDWISAVERGAEALVADGQLRWTDDGR